MATIAELETALVNAHKAGDADAARKLAVVLKAARKDPANLIPGAQIPETLPETPETTMVDKAIGAGETALATIGAIPSAVGMAGGIVKGLGEAALSGQIGTPEGGRIVEQGAQQGAEALTFLQPTTPEGQRMTRAVGESLAMLPPVVPQFPVGRAMAPVRMAAADTTRALASQAVQKSQPAVQAVQNVAQNVRGAVMPGAAAGRESVGAAATPQALQRVETAAQMPVPFVGESAPTLGQATRQFDIQQFEKETAKIPDVGRGLRERVMNQSETVVQNFEALSDMANPTSLDNIVIGRSVNEAVAGKARAANRRIAEAYRVARESGELDEPVEMTGLASRVAELDTQRGLVPTIDAVQREAVRLGALQADEAGNVRPGRVSVNDAETLRQFVGEATDWTDARQARVARIMQESIDQATDGATGEAYRRARALRRQYGQEFERSVLARKLLNTKRNSDERQIAVEDIYDRVVVKSSLEEMNKLRGTLLSSGAEGKQAWANIKAKTIDQIKEAAQSVSQSDERGNPLLSPDKLNRAIQRLDQDGKLQSMFGKKQAQTIRDLGDIANVIYTSPPGAVNHSNTASALRVALDSFATFTATGIPAPAVTALKEAAKYVKDRKTQARVMQSLNAYQRQAAPTPQGRF